MKILVIEDYDGARRSLCRFLTNCGHVVCPASDGAEGIEIAKTNIFDLIITDYDMPKKNGHDVIREVLSAKPGTRIWLMTGSPKMEILEIAKSLGAEEVVERTILLTFLGEKGIS